MVARRLTSARVFFAGLIDYAGLFPPAGLDLPEAMRLYAGYASGEFAWVLGRFILPAASLPEFEALAGNYGIPWRVATIGFPSAQRPYIHAIEVKSEDLTIIERAAVPCYVEMPLERDPSPMLERIKNAGGRAKIRTGALTAQGFPSTKSVARFLEAAASLRLPFKATAGLHHVCRGEYALTYRQDSERATMHGFLNVFIAAALAAAGVPAADLEAALEERSAAAFPFDDDGVAWRSHRIDVEQLTNVRQHFALSFGSCSFEEPIEELSRLGLL